MMSVYFGCMTIVLKLPFTSAASTNGLHRYSGLGPAGVGVVVLGLVGSESVEFEGNVAEVGVVDRFGGRGARVIERLRLSSASRTMPHYVETHPIELKNDMIPELPAGQSTAIAS